MSQLYYVNLLKCCINIIIHYLLPIQPLPTKPTLRIAEIEGGQRLDHDIEIKNDTAIPFFLHWPSDATVSCAAQGCHDAYTFEEMGIWTTKGNQQINNVNSGDDATMGTYTYSSGTSTTTETHQNIMVIRCNLFYQAIILLLSLLSGYQPSVHIYLLSSQVSIPKFANARSYGFSIQFVNGISSIKFGVMDTTLDANNMKPVTETIQLLDPAPEGTGEWVSVEVPKWDYQWVRNFT